MRRPVIPGRSIKGALRAHAERIMRTKFDVPELPEQTHAKKRFMVALDQMHLITALFGRAGQEETKVHDDRAHHGLAALRVHDVVGTASINDGDWQDLLTGEEMQLPEGERMSARLRERLHHSGFYPRTRNAIDRWTSGTASGALFSVLEPREVEWEPIMLEVDERRLAPWERGPAMALLCYVLRDFCAGMIPFGHSTSAGMGSAYASEAELTLANLPDLDTGTDDLPNPVAFHILRSSLWAKAASDALNACTKNGSPVCIGGAA